VGAGARACACARVALLIGLHHTFRHYLINGAIFGGKIAVHKMCFDFLYSFYLKNFVFSEKSSEILP
jgi:hypothetical protein